MVEYNQNPASYDQPVVEDNDNFIGGSKDSLSIKTITLSQYSKCCLEGSKEMSRGGISTRFIKGMYVQVEAPNQREIFINCVKILEVVLTPNILNDKEIQKLLELNSKDFKALNNKNNLILNSILEKKANQGKIPETQARKSFVDYDKQMQQFQDAEELQQIDLYRDRLIVLSRLLASLNYFDEGSIIC